MTDAIQIAIIAATPPTIVATGALIVAIKSRSAIQEVHLSLNSRLTELLNATGRAAHADGVTEGKKVQNETDSHIERY